VLTLLIASTWTLMCSWRHWLLKDIVDAKNSTQNTLHKSKITPARMQLLMCLAIIMNGWAFRIVGGARFADFLANLRPSFSPSGNAARALQLCDAVQPCAYSIV